MIRISPRFFILPLLALIIIGSLPAPANTSAAGVQGCGPAAPHVHASLRAAFGDFDRKQSAAASRICTLYHNSFAGSR